MTVAIHNDTQYNSTLQTQIHQAQLPSQQPLAAQRVDDATIRELAGEILDTGQRFFTDDYDARMVHFAEVMQTLSPEDGGRLIQELLVQDGGALSSWLKLDTVSRMEADSRIDAAQFSAVSEGFAEAFNDGRIGMAEAGQFLQMYALTERAPALLDGQWAQMQAFLDASNGTPAMQQFRAEFAEGLLTQSLDQNRLHDFHAAGVAMQIAHDSGNADLPAQVFATVVEQAGAGINDPLQAAAARDEARGALLEQIGESSIGFENSRGLDGIENPLAVLIESVAAQPSTQQWNEIAVEIARNAQSANSDIHFDPYSDQPIPAISTALTELLGSAHGDAILTELAAWDSSAVAGGDGHAQQFGQNAIELGNLLRLTAFNPDNPNADAALATLQSWTQARKDYLNGVGDLPGMDISTARQQLGMLGGAAFDAVQQMKIDQDNRAAATEALVGFVVDLAVSVVPGGGSISGLVANDLKATFGNNPAVDRAIDQALGGADTLSSSAVDQLKSDISDALSADQASLESLRANASQFVTSAVISGLSPGSVANGSQSHRDIVENHIQTVQTDIQDNRQ